MSSEQLINRLNKMTIENRKMQPTIPPPDVAADPIDVIAITNLRNMSVERLRSLKKDVNVHLQYYAIPNKHRESIEFFKTNLQSTDIEYIFSVLRNVDTVFQDKLKVIGKTRLDIINEFVNTLDAKEREILAAQLSPITSSQV